MRNLTPSEIEAVERLGTTADDWSQILVGDNFRPEQLRQSRLGGRVELGEGAQIIRSYVANYRIGRNSLIEQVTALQCRTESTFGGGVGVAAMNECEGRTVHICDRLSAQTAYMMALYRHRPRLIEALEQMVEREVERNRSTMGEVGEACTISGARFIREVHIGNRVTIDGSSALVNGTILDDATIGVDVKAYDFIVVEGARIANGA
ncbi:MAG: DUF4954 family protein, partial [Alistipes sp.]|nr:DUF4954 family protein [Alistipes sp.]